MIFDNHRPLLQYAGHDPAEEQWRCDVVDQSTKYQYPSTPFPEPQFARKSDDPHQWDSGKYLEGTNLSECEVKKLSKKLKRVSRKLTFQLLAH
jgi:hypothetical protein